MLWARHPLSPVIQIFAAERFGNAVSPLRRLHGHDIVAKQCKVALHAIAILDLIAQNRLGTETEFLEKRDCGRWSTVIRTLNFSSPAPTAIAKLS
jgi:hypothetical protein